MENNTELQVITLKKDGIKDFSLERNRLLEKAEKNWVLFLDSDETISNLEFPVSGKFSGYKIRRDNFFLGKFIGSDWIVRLGKKDAGKWERKVHEVWKIKGGVGTLREAVIRHDTARDLSTYIKKIDFYSTLHAEANKKEGKKSGLFKIILYPAGKFIVTLVKSRSVVFSIMQSLHSFLAWSKLYFLRS